MKKYISLFVFFSLLLTSSFVYAENIESESGSQFEKMNNDRESLREQEKNRLEIMKEEREKAMEQKKSNLELLKQEREQEREKVKNEIELMKEKRIQEMSNAQIEIKKAHEEFQKQIQEKRQELKEKSIANREQLKEKLKTIKDEKKQNAVLNISDNIEKINIKATDRLGNLLENIENVLVKIKDKADKAKNDGSNVDEVYTLITKAEESIKEARESIATQVSKTYKIEVTEESVLKSTMQTIRDAFQKDIKSVQEKVKLAHEAVRASAKSLGSIINTEDTLTEDESENEEEEENEEETETENPVITPETTASATN